CCSPLAGRRLPRRAPARPRPSPSWSARPPTARPSRHFETSVLRTSPICRSAEPGFRAPPRPFTPAPFQESPMSHPYSDRHPALQAHIETRPLADRIEESIVSDRLSQQTQAFIAARDMFFLSTIEHLGRPTVSYKGG